MSPFLFLILLIWILPLCPVVIWLRVCLSCWFSQRISSWKKKDKRMDASVLLRKGSKILTGGNMKTNVEHSLKESPFRKFPTWGSIPYRATKPRQYHGCKKVHRLYITISKRSILRKYWVKARPKPSLANSKFCISASNPKVFFIFQTSVDCLWWT